MTIAEGTTLVDEFFKLPWPNVAGFLTSVSLALFVFGPKIPIIARFLSTGVQEMTGVSNLSKQLHEEHEANLKRFDKLDATLEEQDRKMQQHAEDSDIHNGRKLNADP